LLTDQSDGLSTHRQGACKGPSLLRVTHDGGAPL